MCRRPDIHPRLCSCERSRHRIQRPQELDHPGAELLTHEQRAPRYGIALHDSLHAAVQEEMIAADVECLDRIKRRVRPFAFGVVDDHLVCVSLDRQLDGIADAIPVRSRLFGRRDTCLHVPASARSVPALSQYAPKFSTLMHAVWDSTARRNRRSLMPSMLEPAG